MKGETERGVNPSPVPTFTLLAVNGRLSVSVSDRNGHTQESVVGNVSVKRLAKTSAKQFLSSTLAFLMELMIHFLH